MKAIVRRDRIDILRAALPKENWELLLVAIATASLLCGLCLAPIVCGQKNTPPTSAAQKEDQLRVRLEYNPHDAEAHKRLIALLKSKYAFRAIVLEEAAWIKNNPNNSVWDLTELISYSTVALRDPEFAITELQSYLGTVRREDDPEDYDGFEDRLAGLLVDRGRAEAGVPLLRELVRLNSGEAGFWADYGSALSAAGRLPEAVQALRHSIVLDPSEEITHEDLADALLKRGNLQEAETEYRAAISVYKDEYKTGEPTNSFQSMLRGIVQAESKTQEENALAEMYLKLARVLLKEKKYGDAIAQTQAALEADKYEFVALYYRAEIYGAMGNLTEAAKTRNAAGAAIEKEAASEFAKSPKVPRPDIDPRVIFLMDTLWNGAQGCPALPSEIVSVLEPRLASLSAYERFVLASALFCLGQTSEGRQQWEEAIASDHKLDTAVSQANLGHELLKAGAVSDALPHLERAYELDPQNVTYRMDYEAASQKSAQ